MNMPETKNNQFSLETGVFSDIKQNYVLKKIKFSKSRLKTPKQLLKVVIKIGQGKAETVLPLHLPAGTCSIGDLPKRTKYMLY